MPKTDELLKSRNFHDTERKDNWWVTPLLTAAGLIIFIVYATFRSLHPLEMFGGGPTDHDALLSPFFVPMLFGDSVHAWFGAFPSWWPRLFRSPAMLILWAPLGFRVTCYYFRRAYYTAFFQDPTACAVAEGKEDYEGESNWLIWQNLHRYFLYLALVFAVLLWYDVWVAITHWHDGSWQITVGTLVLAVDAFLITGYTLSCHSFRYLVGGNQRCFTCPANGGTRREEKNLKTVQYGLWTFVSRLNLSHPVWAWLSLYMVAFADFYVWMCATGTWTDYILIS